MSTKLMTIYKKTKIYDYFCLWGSMSGCQCCLSAWCKREHIAGVVGWSGSCLALSREAAVNQATALFNPLSVYFPIRDITR